MFDVCWFLHPRPMEAFVKATILVLLLVGVSVAPLHASDSVTATKDCILTPCTTTLAQFTIATAQVIEWQANYLGSGTQGNDFYIHNVTNSNLIEIPLSTNLSSGFNTGTQFLNPGTYAISINYFGMGPGSYSIIYNKTATIGVSPTNHAFGNQLAGTTSTSFTFTISKTGDLDVTISSVVSSDPAHFEVLGAPTGQGVGPNRTFQVRFNAGVTAGTFGANITVSGTSSMPVTPFTVTVSGTTNPNTATIGISPTNHAFGNQLAGTTSASFAFTISKTGSLDVTISSLVSSDPAHFEVLGAPIGQGVGPNRTFQVRFNAGVTAGTFGANITVSGTSSMPVTPFTVTVSGATIPNVPNITCVGSACATAADLGTADGDIGEVRTRTVSFQNTGPAQLTVTSIQLVNDSPASPFSLPSTPSTAPVAGGGGSRSVQVRFAPPPGEGTYCGHLVIQTDDPDEPVKLCYFQARGHHPEPRMRLDSTVLDYRQVELGFSFTKAIVIHNDGEARLTVTVSNISTTDPVLAPNLVHWSSLEAGGPFTIDPGAPPKIFLETYTPLALGTHTIRLRITSNDANPTQDITLTGEGIAPVPIDSVLVLDRSGSMDESAGPRRKIDALQTAADMYVHLLRPETGSGTGDKIGLVRYDHNNDVYLTLDFVTPNNAAGTHLAKAEDRLSPAAIADSGRLQPAGATGIGGAIQRGAGMFALPPSGTKHVMVLLTDGMENVPPYINDVIGGVRTTDPSLKMYSIGLGSDIEPAKLQLITNVGNGYFQVTDDLSGASRFNLETFYFKIFSNASGMNLVVDPTSAIYVSGLAPVVVSKALIVSSDRSATFLVLDDPALRAFYNLELVDPHSQVIVLGSTVGGIPVQQQQRYNYTIYRVVFPDPALASSYVGGWVLRLTPNGKWNAADVKKILGERRQGAHDFINPYQGLVPVGFAAAVHSNYRMEVAVLPSNYLPGANVTLTASLSDRGWPSTTGDVQVDVRTPGATIYAGIRLYDDGTHGDAVATDGTWTNHFVQTSESGAYRFFFHAIGRNERGELAPREETRYAALMTLTDVSPPDRPCIPCWLLRLLWLLVIVALLWIVRALYRQGRTVQG